MFTDCRSKRVVFVAHCLLNQNSISDGTADMPSQFEAVINMLMANKVGIIQLSCPELLCLGLDRQDKSGGERDLLKENTRIRTLMQQRTNIDLLKQRAQDVVSLVREYTEYGFSILGLIGVNRSPSCGVETTSIDEIEQPGFGIFTQIITEELQREGLKLKMAGIKTTKIKESLEAVQELLSTCN